MKSPPMLQKVFSCSSSKGASSTSFATARSRKTEEVRDPLAHGNDSVYSCATSYCLYLFNVNVGGSVFAVRDAEVA